MKNTTISKLLQKNFRPKYYTFIWLSTSRVAGNVTSQNKQWLGVHSSCQSSQLLYKQKMTHTQNRGLIKLSQRFPSLATRCIAMYENFV